mmetsp:Transcript_4144/g.6083  ORF Transcript_4144/g.6083 Transcript_4144/m.6083 type:complete len:93 (+) Transcript_4144:139-417(+)
MRSQMSSSKGSRHFLCIIPHETLHKGDKDDKPLAPDYLVRVPVVLQVVQVLQAYRNEALPQVPYNYRQSFEEFASHRYLKRSLDCRLQYLYL